MDQTSKTKQGTLGRVTDGQYQLLSAMPELADCKYPEVRDTVPAEVYVDPARYEVKPFCENSRTVQLVWIGSASTLRGL